MCIHNAKDPALCQKCLSNYRKANWGKKAKETRLKNKVDTILADCIEMHIGSYYRQNTYFNVHVNTIKLARSLLKELKKYGNQSSNNS